MKLRDITLAAEGYLWAHPELFTQAAETIRRYPPLWRLAVREDRQRKAIRKTG